MNQPEPQDEVETHRMPLIEHLIELRNRVVYSMIAVGIGAILGLWRAKDIIGFLEAPVRRVLPGSADPTWIDELYLQWTAPMSVLPGWEQLMEVQARGDLVQINAVEGVSLFIRVGLISGVLFALPVVAWQLWSFVAPGLYATERRVVLPLTLSSTVLFFIGAGFAYLVIAPMAFGFFLTLLDYESMVSIKDATETVVRIMLAFGICYQLPVVIWFLARIGLVDHKDLIRGFRYAVVGIFAVAAFVTPPDLVTQFFLGIPLVGLYGVSIGVAWLFTTKKRTIEGS